MKLRASLGDEEAVELVAAEERRRTAERVQRIPRSSMPPELLEALRDSDPLVRRMVATALGQAGDPEAVAPLKELLRDADPAVREAAARAIEFLDPTWTRPSR